MMLLNVGCGASDVGDVNVDLFRVGNPLQCCTPYNGKNIRTFVQADAHKLPFKDKCFDETLCDNTLEHCLCPYEVMREMIRVTKNQIEIWLPMYEGDETPKTGITHTHYYSWKRVSLKNFMGLFGMRFQIEEHLERGAGQFRVLFYLEVQR